MYASSRATLPSLPDGPSLSSDGPSPSPDGPAGVVGPPSSAGGASRFSTATIPRAVSLWVLDRSFAWIRIGALRVDAPATATTLSPDASKIAVASVDGSVTVWSAEGDVRGGELERLARLDLAPVRNAERDARRAARVSWRDLGAGAFALAVASGTNVAVFVERRGRWHVVARTTVPGDEPVGAITWTPTSDAVVVAVGIEPRRPRTRVGRRQPRRGSLLGRAREPTFEPRRVGRVGVRGVARVPPGRAGGLVGSREDPAREESGAAALAYLRDATGTRTTEEETGPVPVAPAELLEGEAGEEETNEGEREEKTNAGARANTEAKESMASNANANANADADAPPDFDPSAFGFGGPAPAPAPAAAPPVVPEFDADAFGGFAGFGAAAPRTGPALFTFGQDLDATTPTSTTSTTSTTATATSTRRTPRAGDDGPFSSAEAEEGAQLIASRGARLPGIDAEDRVALLGVFHALRADGGADSATDEAGRRFNALRRGRALRRARGGGVDPRGPRGEELAWALHATRRRRS